MTNGDFSAKSTCHEVVLVQWSPVKNQTRKLHALSEEVQRLPWLCAAVQCTSLQPCSERLQAGLARDADRTACLGAFLPGRWSFFLQGPRGLKDPSPMRLYSESILIKVNGAYSQVRAVLGGQSRSPHRITRGRGVPPARPASFPPPNAALLSAGDALQARAWQARATHARAQPRGLPASAWAGASAPLKARGSR